MFYYTIYFPIIQVAIHIKIICPGYVKLLDKLLKSYIINYASKLCGSLAEIRQEESPSITEQDSC